MAALDAGRRRWLREALAFLDVHEIDLLVPPQPASLGRLPAAIPAPCGLAARRPFRVVCNEAAVGCAAMGMKRAPAVRLCVTCEQLKSADQFAPGRYKCLACQSAGRRRRRRPTRTQHDPHASLHGRARDQALRRLGREHLDAYRAHYQAQRREIPSTVPADLARKRAVNRALRALQRQHRLRYGELYQQELRRARSRRHLRGPGRPAGTSNRLTVRAEPASTWQPDGAGGGQSAKERSGQGSEPT